MRTAAVRRHLAEAGPRQARVLRLARQRSLVAGTLGGGMLVLVAWLASVALRDEASPAVLTKQAPAVAAPETPAVVAPQSPVPVPVAQGEPEAVPSFVPEAVAAVAAVSPLVSAFAAAARPPVPLGAAAPAANAPQVEPRLPMRPRPVPARAVASRNDFGHYGVAVDPAGDDEAPESGAFEGWPRPSASAYLPPDTPFELPAHTRLSGG